jgi:hypothetical protein
MVQVEDEVAEGENGHLVPSSMTKKCSYPKIRVAASIPDKANSAYQE